MSTTRPLRVNERIRVPEVRLIDETGHHLGIIRTEEALRLARERGLDLVEVQPNASPPVCRIMDYGKYRYEESRRERESRKRQKTIEVKEIRLRPRIDTHDLETKVRQIQQFLTDGAKVKVTVLFRGREIVYQDLGERVLQRVIDLLGPRAVVEQPPHAEGRTLVMFLAPGHVEVTRTASSEEREAEGQ
ncbi:translation initiation factor IF-3 [Thermomicrobium sp.]|uniref:translation initiation factor IF-3 n=1 Tax=Thermomicrobium sp. TaxID=1969469 RepID=UPI001B160BFC|nr:translation initiation factor IF-3 [Thermomicrobium sp.]MBO9305950.1 translation initiation factor IF-3 [Thermomicrobium sp.]MBO9350178.1 translation initiation factor IF-3 [Thermomicrobium sp.]